MITGEEFGGMVGAAFSLFYGATVMWATLHEDDPFWAAFLNPFGKYWPFGGSARQWRNLRRHGGEPDA